MSCYSILLTFHSLVKISKSYYISMSLYDLYALLYPLCVATISIHCYILYVLLQSLCPATNYMPCYIIYVLLQSLCLTTISMCCYNLYLCTSEALSFSDISFHLKTFAQKSFQLSDRRQILIKAIFIF